MDGRVHRGSAVTLKEMRTAARYQRALAGFLRRPLSPQHARALIASRREGRARSFLTLLERGVFAPGGVAPYRALMAHAGFDLERVSTAVRRDGVEGALDRLYEKGVHLSLDELKGHAPIVRPGLELAVTPADFDNPVARTHFAVRTGGSASRPRRILIDLDEVVHEAAHLQLMLEGLGASDRPQAAWFPPPPSVAGIKWALRHAKRGRAPDRWFAQRPVGWRGEEAPFGAFTAATTATAWALGARLPWPRHTPPAQAVAIARWLEHAATGGRPAMLRTYPSSAVRVCQAAEQVGVDLHGTTFSLVGEPCTPTKHSVLRASGADVVCTYFITEAGQIGTACTADGPHDDVHVMTDRVSIAQRPRRLPSGTRADALFVTTLSASAPKLLINYETGDEAQLQVRDCGCPAAALGLDQHLHRIRSYEKLVGEGMRFDGAELQEILEQVLPERFGGIPTDYQLVECEQAGLTRLELLVHPRLGPVDERAVIDVTIEHLAARGVGQAMMADIWRRSDTVTVARREPRSTAAGKVQLLHVERG